MPEINKCFHCNGDLIENTSQIRKDIDYDCVRCRRGWKFVNGYWHSRGTSTVEMYRIDGTQVYNFHDDYEKAAGLDEPNSYTCPSCGKECDDSTIHSCTKLQCKGCGTIFEPNLTEQRSLDQE